jgi:DNA-binding NarL/FixJ family response regulator
MNKLILASSDNKARLSSWAQGLIGCEITTLLLHKKNALWSYVVRVKPNILLLDAEFFELNNLSDVSNLHRLCTQTKVIIFSDELTENQELDFVQAGVRGCCRSDIEPNLLNQVVMSVQKGELWVRRSLTCRLIKQLEEKNAKNIAYRATLGLINKLTRREYEIALCVSSGQNTKQIAQSRAITERTVKAHLAEVYFKLGVRDSYTLASCIEGFKSLDNCL